MRASYLLLLTLVLLPSSARAQPLFHCEHHWAVMLNGQRYGLVQVKQVPGDFRWTEVWMGRYKINVNCRAVALIGRLLVAPADLVTRIEWRSFRRLS